MASAAPCVGMSQPTASRSASDDVCRRTCVTRITIPPPASSVPTRPERRPTRGVRDRVQVGQRPARPRGAFAPPHPDGPDLGDSVDVALFPPALATEGLEPVGLDVHRHRVFAVIIRAAERQQLIDSSQYPQIPRRATRIRLRRAGVMGRRLVSRPGAPPGDALGLEFCVGPVRGRSDGGALADRFVAQVPRGNRPVDMGCAAAGSRATASACGD